MSPPVEVCKTKSRAWKRWNFHLCFVPFVESSPLSSACARSQRKMRYVAPCAFACTFFFTCSTSNHLAKHISLCFCLLPRFFPARVFTQVAWLLSLAVFFLLTRVPGSFLSRTTHVLQSPFPLILLFSSTFLSGGSLKPHSTLPQILIMRRTRKTPTSTIFPLLHLVLPLFFFEFLLSSLTLIFSYGV